MTEFIPEFQAALESSWSTAPRDHEIENDHVKEDLETLSKDLAAMDKALKGTPINLTKEEIEKVKEEVHAYTISYVKASTTFKNLPSPISPKEGLEILPIILTIQKQFVEIMGDCAARLPQTEIDAPGYGKFFLYVLRNSIDPYYDSLARVAPSTIPQPLIQELKAEADAALLNAVAGLPV